MPRIARPASTSQTQVLDDPAAPPVSVLVSPTPDEIATLGEPPAAVVAQPIPSNVPDHYVADPDSVEDDELPPSEAATRDSATASNPGGFVTKADLAQFADSIAGGIERGMRANAPKRKVSFGDYDPKTAFQPDKRKTIALTRACFQNGAQMRPINMTNREISMLNAITHSGRYIDRLVEVVLVPNGADDEVHLRYNCKTIDQRMENKGKWQSLDHLLVQVTTAQAEERRLDELHGAERASRPRR